MDVMDAYGSWTVLDELVNAHMNMAEAAVDILAKNMVLTSVFWVKLDCQVFWMFGWQRLSYVFLVFYIGVHGHHRHPLGGIISLRETPKQLCGLHQQSGEQQMGESEF